MPEKPTTLFIHPASIHGGKHHVSEKHTDRNGKTRYVHIAFFDPPGTYYNDSWNVHYDGCDYEKTTLQECKDFLRYLLDRNVSFAKTTDKYE